MVFSSTARPLCVTATSGTTGGRLLSLLQLDCWSLLLLRGEDPRVKGNEWRVVCVCGSARAIDVSAALRLIGSHGGCFDRHLGADP